MLKFKSLGFGLAILIALIFTGCGDSSSSPSNDDDTTEIDTGIIDSSYLYSTKFTEASEIATKSDYETIADHELRVNKYIEEQDIIYFDVGIYDSYDSETKVLSLYGFTDYNSSKHSFSMGMWNFQYIDVYNFNLFPITVKILSAESDDLFPTERSVFHEYTIESDIAYDLKDNYRILIGVRLNTSLIKKYNSSLGMVYRFSTDLVSFKIYNTADKDNIIKEFTLSDE